MVSGWQWESASEMASGWQWVCESQKECGSGSTCELVAVFWSGCWFGSDFQLGLLSRSQYGSAFSYRSAWVLASVFGWGCA